MVLGILGTGTIAKAIVTGLYAAEGFNDDIWLSPRSAAIAQALAARFDRVRIATSNQDLVNRSELLVVSVRPQVAESILEPLVFRAEQRIVSLVATFSHERLAPLLAPASSITRAAPLPPIAFHLGPVALFPDDPEAVALFGLIGTPVPVSSQIAFEALFATTSEMAAFFELQRSCAEWLEQQGVATDQAHAYVTSIFQALAETGRRNDGSSLADLVSEHMTRGGLNEQLREDLERDGVFDSHRRALDRILARIRSA